MSFIPQEKSKSPKRLQCTVTQRYNNIDVGSLARPGHAKMFLMPYANNTGADQPAHPRSLISTFVVRCLDSMICILAIYKVWGFKLASVVEQPSLNLTWSKISEDLFSCDVALAVKSWVWDLILPWMWTFHMTIYQIVSNIFILLLNGIGVLIKEVNLTDLPYQ